MPSSAYGLALLFFVTGLWHLAKPKFFLSITPLWVPWPKLANALATLGEFSLAVGYCFEASRTWAAWGTIALLLAVWPVHFDMLRKGRGKGQPRVFLWGRVFFQIFLLAWAFSFR